MKTDSIILDIDGTIWNTTGIVAKGWNKAIEKTFPKENRVTPEILKGQFGKTMNEIAADLFPNLTTEEKEILKKQCHTEEKALLADLEEDISFPNVRQLIPELAKTYKLFIVSNCGKGYIHVTMDKNNIREYITDWECHGNTGKSKGENIKAVIERNNLKSPVYIGDTQSDLEACQLAEIPFIWASYGFGHPENYTAKLEDFGNLPELLKTI